MQTSVKVEEIARWFGVSGAAVRQLARREIVAKAGRGEYDLEQSVEKLLRAPSGTSARP